MQLKRKIKMDKKEMKIRYQLLRFCGPSYTAYSILFRLISFSRTCALSVVK